MFATRSKCIASSNKRLTSSNKKAIRNKCIASGAELQWPPQRLCGAELKRERERESTNLTPALVTCILQ